MSNTRAASLALLHTQRSHVLFVSSNPKPGQEPAFLQWYQGAYLQAVFESVGVLSARHYERHEVDITCGRYAPLPFRYLGFYELCFDGADAAGDLIENIALLHRQQPAADAPATWLYYPVCEKVGRVPAIQPSMVTLAFANGLPGQEQEFREWYATRHIRHALNIDVLVGGQCFERTLFQKSGAMDARFSTIAVYEQEGPPEAIIERFASLPKEIFHFPMLDRSRFAEWSYRPL